MKVTPAVVTVTGGTTIVLPGSVTTLVTTLVTRLGTGKRVRVLAGNVIRLTPVSAVTVLASSVMRLVPP